MDTEKIEGSVPENANSSEPALTSEKPDAVNAKSVEPEKDVEVKRDFFELVGDFFQKMTVGIFKFAFYKLPVSIIKFILGMDFRAIIKRLYSIGRIIFWFTVWVLAIFVGWIAFALQQFLNFWRWVWTKIVDFAQIIWSFVSDNIGPIWFIIAIIGSIYGLLYVTLRHRAKRKNRPFNGVFPFLHRKRNKSSAGETANDAQGSQK